MGSIIFKDKEERKKLIGTINNICLTDKQGIIYGVDGGEYIFNVNKIINSSQLDENRKTYTVTFTAIFKKNNWRVSNVSILDTNRKYSLSPEVIVSETAMIPGWTVVECSGWYVKSVSLKSFDECKLKLMHRAKLAGSTCVIDVECYRVDTKGRSGYYETYHCRGRLANIAKEQVDGDYKLIELNRLEPAIKEAYLNRLDIRNKDLRRRRLFTLAILPIAIPIGMLNLLFLVLLIIFGLWLCTFSNTKMWLEYHEVRPLREVF